MSAKSRNHREPKSYDPERCACKRRAEAIGKLKETSEVLMEREDAGPDEDARPDGLDRIAEHFKQPGEQMREMKRQRVIEVAVETEDKKNLRHIRPRQISNNDMRTGRQDSQMDTDDGETSTTPAHALSPSDSKEAEFRDLFLYFTPLYASIEPDNDDSSHQINSARVSSRHADRPNGLSQPNDNGQPLCTIYNRISCGRTLTFLRSASENAD